MIYALITVALLGGFMFAMAKYVSFPTIKPDHRNNGDRDKKMTVLIR